MIVQTVGIDGPFAGMLLLGAARRIVDGVPANLERLAVRAATTEKKRGRRRPR